MSSNLRAELMLGISGQAADPNAPLVTKRTEPLITIHDRLEAGNLTIEEVRTLANRSKTGFYADLKAGLVTIRKIGRKSVVPGPVAKRYIAGQPVACARDDTRKA